MAIASITTELWLSPISVWEVLLLVEKGRISLKSDTIPWIDQSLEALAICDYVIPLYVEKYAKEFKKLNLVALKKVRFELMAS